MTGQNSANFLPYGAVDLEADVERRCASARAFEEIEDFAKAREALGVFFKAEGALLEMLPELLRAEVLLRTGSLLRRVGGRDKTEDELEEAKSYLLPALEGFQRLGERDKAAETLIALAACYWGLGIFVKSRQLLNDPIFSELETPIIKANRLYMLAIVARSEGAYPEAVYLLREVVSSCEQFAPLSSTCKYRGALGNALLLLGEKEQRPEYTNEALLHYAISSQEAEESGSVRYAGFVINNVGYIFFKHNRLNEALEHLSRARKIFERLLDVSCIAQVDETCAQVLNAQGRYSEAAALLRRSIQTFEITGQAAQQGEALLTLCTSLIGLGQPEEAEECASRAAEIYALHEIHGGEGHARLIVAELLAKRQTPPLGKLLHSFVRATRLIASEGDAKVLERIDRVEQKLLELSDHAHIRRLPDISEVRQPVSEATLWDEGLTLQEAQARVEEWYLARLILENGTLEAIAQELGLSAEGVRQKIARYKHLDILRRAMCESNVVPLNAKRRSQRPDRVRLHESDNHLAALGPRGGDSLGVKPCENVTPEELVAVKIAGLVYAGYLDTTGETPTLYSGHENYPAIPCKDGEVIGRVIGYWPKGKGRQKMKPLKVN